MASCPIRSIFAVALVNSTALFPGPVEYSHFRYTTWQYDIVHVNIPYPLLIAKPTMA